MTHEERERLSTFEARLRHLIHLHDELKDENARLRKQLDELNEVRMALQTELNTSVARYTNLKTVSTISLDGSDVKETQQRLSNLVREVDKCIALLNE